MGRFVEKLRSHLDAGAEFNESLCHDVMFETARDLKAKKVSAVALPLRHALSGRAKGPGVSQIMDVLGPERTLARLHAGLAHVVKENSKSS